MNKDPIPLGHKDSLSKIMIEYFIIDLVRWNSPSFNYHIKTSSFIKYIPELIHQSEKVPQFQRLSFLKVQFLE